MDLATIVGMIAGIGIIVAAMLLGGNISQFIDIPSVLIVIGGGFAATMIRFPIAGVFQAFGTGGKVAFTHKKTDPRAMVEQIADLADLVRKNGPLGLENAEVEDTNLAKGVQYIADGYEINFIRDAMERERDLYLTRLEEGKRVFKSLGDAAPAFGMIGTLVGLVQLLANMDDPASIGPAMATALLTTMYGAVLANLVALPVADKLDAKLGVEEINQTLIIDGVLQIREAKSPALIREMLIAYLPESQRSGLVDEAA